MEMFRERGAARFRDGMRRRGVFESAERLPQKAAAWKYRGGQGGNPLPEPTLDHRRGGDDVDGVRDLRRSLCCSGRGGR